MNARQVFIATLAVLAGLATGFIFVTSIRILIILLIAILLASALRPMIMRLVSWRIPAGLAIPLVYTLVIGLALLLFVGVLPPIINQFADYLNNDWRLANRVISTVNWAEQQLTTLTGQEVVLAESENIRTFVSNTVDSIRLSAPDLLDDIGSFLGEVVLILVMGVYWLTAREKSINFLSQLFSLEARDEFEDAVRRIEESMGTYIRGIVLVGLFVGFANFLILTLLQIPNASTYGFIIGITTLLPVLGGFIGGGAATLLALLGTPLHGLAVFGTFVAVQQIEVHYLTPRTMARSVGVDPLLVMVAIFIGFALYGVIGAIISIPILGAINVFLAVFVVEPRREEVASYDVQEGVPIMRPSSPVRQPAPAPAGAASGPGPVEVLRPVQPDVRESSGA